MCVADDSRETSRFIYFKEKTNQNVVCCSCDIEHKSVSLQNQTEVHFLSLTHEIWEGLYRSHHVGWLTVLLVCLSVCLKVKWTNTVFVRFSWNFNGGSVWWAIVCDIFFSFYPMLFKKAMGIQSNFNASNIFGTIENCSRHGYFESLRVNHDARSGSK